MARLEGRGVYAITDGPRTNLIAAVEAALAGGAAVLQYRDKTRDTTRRADEARALRVACKRHAVPLIINDDIDLAMAIGADGVHLGAEDSGIVEARQRLGEAAIIGVSCYASIERARQLAAAGADYLAFGAFFASTTKPLAARAAFPVLRDARTLGLPLVAIGGINADNAPLLIDAGVDYLAVIASVFGASDIESATRALASCFT
ncbi:MAG: thiamine phosphate synthase [Xanthomonadales bacterium]|nr:thiamine phosphate synthase [Xanthomonadales bacterium]